MIEIHCLPGWNPRADPLFKI